MASIEHWKEPNLLRINFREGQVDYSREVSPGVVFHYARTEDEEDVLVYVEFYEWPGRGLDSVSFKRIGSSGERTEGASPDELVKPLNRRKP